MNPLLQNEQNTCFLSVSALCVNTCCPRVPLLLNRFLHVSHSNGRPSAEYMNSFLACMASWRFRCRMRLNTLEHVAHSNVFCLPAFAASTPPAFSSMSPCRCCFRCRFRLKSREKFASQSGHWKRVSLSRWYFSCCRMQLRLANRLPQTLHWNGRSSAVYVSWSTCFVCHSWWRCRFDDVTNDFPHSMHL